MKKIPVLIADTFGDSEYLNPKQWDLIPHLRNRVMFHRVDSAPTTKPHPHGWMVFSKFWPTTLQQKVFDNVEFHLMRFIDGIDTDVEWQVLDKAKELYNEHGCLVWNNSWGADRGSGFDKVISGFWEPWSNEVNKFTKENPNFIPIFSSGNNGPNYLAGWPQSQLENCYIIGANQRSGKLAKFSCGSTNLSVVLGGFNSAVADPFSGGFTFASGTSFSGPAFGALALWYLANNLGDSNTENVDFNSWIQQEVVKLEETKGEWNQYWGLGDLEPTYQVIAKEYNAWKTLKYPGMMRSMMSAKMFAPFHDKTMPCPKIPGAGDKPVLPK